MTQSFLYRTKKAFTIVELLIVVVVVAVLAAITAVGYSGITRSAEEAVIKSGLKNSATELGLYYVSNGRYPVVDVLLNDGTGLKSSNENTKYVYWKGAYCISGQSKNSTGSILHITSQDQTPEQGPCPDPEPPHRGCFDFNAATQTITYTRSHVYEGSVQVATCPADLPLPRYIDGVEVKGISYLQDLTKKSVYIPDSVETIGERAFWGNKLEYIVIPDSVKTIGYGAFRAAFSGSAIVIFGNKLEVIGERSFSANGKGNQVSLGDIIMPASLKFIGKDAFEYSTLNSIRLNDSLAAIENRAFYGTDILNQVISIPSSVKSLGVDAFYQSTIKELTLSEGIETIGSYAFAYNDISSVTIPRSVTTLGQYIFYNNPGIVCNIPTGRTFTNTGCATINYY